MSDYESRIKIARETIAAHVQRIDCIARAMTRYCKDFYLEDSKIIDFSPVLKAYACSKDLDPKLLESETLYKDLIPTMTKEVLEHFNDSDPYHWAIRPKEEISQAEETIEKWIDLVGSAHDWRFKACDYKEFVEAAQSNGPSDRCEPLITGYSRPVFVNPLPGPARGRAKRKHLGNA
jgi:hypothetical protein